MTFNIFFHDNQQGTFQQVLQSFLSSPEIFVLGDPVTALIDFLSIGLPGART